MRNMTLVLGTGNRGKIDEFHRLLNGPWQLSDLSQIPGWEPVDEDGTTLADNARRKARAAACHLKQWVLADDTGLEVDALGGGPGVQSAAMPVRVLPPRQIDTCCCNDSAESPPATGLPASYAIWRWPTLTGRSASNRPAGAAAASVPQRRAAVVSATIASLKSSNITSRWPSSARRLRTASPTEPGPSKRSGRV